MKFGACILSEVQGQVCRKPIIREESPAEMLLQYVANKVGESTRRVGELGLVDKRKRNQR